MALVGLLTLTFTNPAAIYREKLFAAGGDAARGWLLGMLTCLCLVSLVAAIVGGVIFFRSRRKPEPKPTADSIVSQTLPPMAWKPPQVTPPAASLPLARLVARQGLVDHRQIDLTKQSVTVGRDPSNSLVVNDSITSRHHARIEPVNNAWVIVDTESINGTLVNGKSISRHILNAGDRIEIGTAVLEFQIVPPQEEAPNVSP